MKRYLALILALLLLLAAAGCTVRDQSSEEPEETENPAQTDAPAKQTPKPGGTPETEPPAPVEETEPPYRNPLNGAPMDEPLRDRPFAVMVNNKQEAQPQCGISKADIVYEIPAEGGVTRMMALFTDIRAVEHLGSIRSIRPYYIDVSLAYGAVTCHAGGSEDAYSRIRNEGIENIDGVRGSYSGTVFYRDSDRRYAGYAIEHTLFTEGQKLYDCAETLGYGLTVESDYESGLNFVKDGTPADGEAASAVDVTFNVGKSTSLFYQADSGLYTATQYGGDYIDGNTKDAVGFRNLMMLYANTAVLDGYGRLSVDLFSGGRGYFACGGKWVPITWEHTAGDCFHYYLEDGSELSFGVGTTYIAVLPENAQASVLFG